MDKILSLVNDNAVTFLHNPNNKEIQDIIKNIAKQENPRIIFTSIHSENLMGLHAQLNYDGIENQLILEQGKLNKNIILCDKEVLFKLYVTNNNLADIIIFYDSEVENKYYQLIWQLWKNNSDLRGPRLVLISQDYNLSYCPLEKNKDNSYTFNHKIASIEYSTKNYPRNNKNIINGIFDKVSLENNEIYQELILVPNKRFIPELMKKLKEKYKSYEIYSFDENIYQSHNAKIFSNLEKHRIVISLHHCAALIDFKNLYYIYDSCQTSHYFYGNYQVYNISKKTAQKTAKEAKKRTYRICSEDNYDRLNLVEKSYLDKDGIAKLILASYCQDADIDIAHEQEIIEFLERINLIRAGKVTKRAKLVANSPLGVRASNFIHNWESKKLPLFPALILAVIIDQCKNNLLYTPTVENDKNEPVGRKMSKNEKTIITYMDIFLSFISTFKDIEVEKEKIQKWCQENFVHANTFNFLITKLKETIKYYRKFLNFELALYESKNVLKKALPLLCFNYSENIYKSHDKINHIYHDNKGETSVLDKHRFDNGSFFFPEKFISLYQIETSQGHRIVLFYIIIED